MPTPPSRLDTSQEAIDWLKRQQVHFDHLVASVDDHAIFMTSPDGTILDWNAGAERLQGYAAEEIVGRNIACFYPAEEIAEGVPGRELDTAFATGKYVEEGWRLRKDGSRFRAAVTLTAIRAENGEVAGFLNITRDLTQRKMAEELLRESEERMRLLIESVRDYAIFMLDPEGHVMTWNSGARRIKQYEEAEILGRHFSVFYPPEALAMGLPEALLKEALRRGRAADEGWRVRKDGSRFWGNVVITALFDAKRELRGFTKITRDLSEQRQIELLRESGKRKDTFLATLAHELRNPLAPILTAVDMLQRAPEDREMVLKLGGILKAQVGQMAHLIEDLLDMARITSGKIELRKSRFPLAEVIATAVETIRPVMDERGHELVCELPAQPVEMEADPFRLVQILTNLLSNAAKYSPAPGKIFLTVAREEPEWVAIRVKDRGVGILPVLQGAIFQLFEQGIHGAADGLGIGLTLVRTLAELHGGTISVASEGEGCGSEFTLRLPTPVPGFPGAGDSSGPSPAQAAKGPTRVLVADDSKNAADIMGLFLRMEGYEVAIAYDGQAAVETAAAFAPKLAILDLGMPRLNGFDAARAIRKKFPDIILAALSGWGSSEDRRRSEDAGFDLHIVKPPKPDDIRAVLEVLKSRA